LGKGRELALQLHRDAMPAPPFIKRTVRTVSVARSIADLFEEPIVSVMRALLVGRFLNALSAGQV
jgi:hypothetical protein